MTLGTSFSGKRISAPPNFDEWSALASFLSDMIEKYAEILIPEIEAVQITVDELIAA